MKKIILLLSMFSVLGLCTNVYAAKTVCDENYESYKIGERPPGWDAPDVVEAGTYYQVEQDPNDPNNKVLALHANDKDLISDRFYFSEPIGGITTVTMRVRLGDNGPNVSWISWFREIFANMLFQKGFTMITSNGQKVMDNFAANFETWYDIKYEINFYTQRFSYYFDGKLIYDNVGFLYPGTNQLSYMEFKLQSGTTYIDDINITMEGGVQKLYTMLEVDEKSNYKYSSGKGTLQNVYTETTTANFMKHFVFVDGADFGLYEEDGVTPYTGTYVKNGTKLVMESPDKTQRTEVLIYTRKRLYGTHTAKLAQGSVCFAVGSEYVLSNNVRTLIDEEDPSVRCYTEDDEIYVPLRKLCDGFGIEILWDADKKCVLLNGITEITGINKNGTTFVRASQIEQITGRQILYNNGTLIVVRDKDLNMRSTVHDTVMTELYKRLTVE